MNKKGKKKKKNTKTRSIIFNSSKHRKNIVQLNIKYSKKKNINKHTFFFLTQNGYN